MIIGNEIKKIIAKVCSRRKVHAPHIKIVATRAGDNNTHPYQYVRMGANGSHSNSMRMQAP